MKHLHKRGLRKCWMCQRILPLNEIFFYKSKNNSFGFDSRCKSCDRIKKYSLRGKFIECKRRAKRKGNSFSLTFEEFKNFWGKPCFYCGGENKTIGLDRVNSLKGYSLDNIVSSCKPCNSKKSNLSIEDMFEKYKERILFHGEKIVEYKKILNNIKNIHKKPPSGRPFGLCLGMGR